MNLTDENKIISSKNKAFRNWKKHNCIERKYASLLYEKIIDIKKEFKDVLVITSDFDETISKISKIPHMACKLNEHGTPIIGRVFLYNDMTNYFINEPISTEKNYFTPIVLNEFTINLLDQNNEQVELEMVLEFEVTILKQSLSQR